jgi:hypothetical protein
MFQGAAKVSAISGDDETNLVDSDDSPSHTWETFSSLLNLTCFMIILVTYIILLIGFIP